MANKFGIPTEVEKSIRARDRVCVYCRKKMKEYLHTIGSPKDKATIEHLNFDGPFYWKKGLKESDIVICCQSCNSSRGEKKLVGWFKTQYCIDGKINKKMVAMPVKNYIQKNPRK
ncbi:HNH endonuclease [Patescibacteria group bacterium]|nr:HNH endonuclease [Patescibacteria group bacterium]